MHYPEHFDVIVVAIQCEVCYRILRRELINNNKKDHHRLSYKQNYSSAISYNIKPTQRPNEEEIRTPARISLGYNHFPSLFLTFKHRTVQTLRSQDRDLGRPLRRLRDPQRKDAMVQVRRDVLRVDRAREPDGTGERRTAGADEVVASRDLLVGLGWFVGDGVRVCACS